MSYCNNVIVMLVASVAMNPLVSLFCSPIAENVVTDGQTHLQTRAAHACRGLIMQFNPFPPTSQSCVFVHIRIEPFSDHRMLLKAQGVLQVHQENRWIAT